MNEIHQTPHIIDDNSNVSHEDGETGRNHGTNEVQGQRAFIQIHDQTLSDKYERHGTKGTPTHMNQGLITQGESNSHKLDTFEFKHQHHDSIEEEKKLNEILNSSVHHSGLKVSNRSGYSDRYIIQQYHPSQINATNQEEEPELRNAGTTNNQNESTSSV